MARRAKKAAKRTPRGGTIARAQRSGPLAGRYPNVELPTDLRSSLATGIGVLDGMLPENPERVLWMARLERVFDMEPEPDDEEPERLAAVALAVADAVSEYQATRKILESIPSTGVQLAELCAIREAAIDLQRRLVHLPADAEPHMWHMAYKAGGDFHELRRRLRKDLTALASLAIAGSDALSGGKRRTSPKKSARDSLVARLVRIFDQWMIRPDPEDANYVPHDEDDDPGAGAEDPWLDPCVAFVRAVLHFVGEPEPSRLRQKIRRLRPLHESPPE